MQSLRLFVAFALVVSVFGCNSPSKEPVAEVTGRVTSAGAPLQVAGREMGLGRVEVRFHLLDADGKPHDDFESTATDEQGNFTVRGRDGQGIKPGKYRIAVYQWDPDPTDKLEGKFSSENSKIEREVGPKGATIEIDVSKPAG
jgi:hypothetical protein